MNKNFFLLIAVLAVMAGCASSKKNQGSLQDLALYLLNEKELADLKNNILAKDAKSIITYQTLVAKANKALANPLYSVTFLKDSVAPTGDKRDYISMGPYWWPDPKKPDGKPYIRRDGEVNPERNKLKDSEQQDKMVSDVQSLALGYYFTGREDYVAKAIPLLNTWYIDPATRMNPHLNYGQGIPGITLGRGIGIIETRELVGIPDALALMQSSKQLKPSLVSGVKQWFSEYLHWMLNSPIGQDEQKAKNNHGTYYDVQAIGLALFTGDAALAKKIVNDITKPRVDVQFTVEGAQPLELERTRSWSYSAMNVLGWVQLAILAQKAGVDLWHYETPDGKSIHKTLTWFGPYLLDNKKWETKQISSSNNDNLFLAYRLAMKHYNDPYFQKVMQQYSSYDWNQLW